MLRLTRSVYDHVVDHARTGAPEEVVGVLGGDYGDERSRADRALGGENVAAEPETTYELAPEEQLALMNDLEDGGREVVGFYHSHPAGPPGPSRTDERRATWEGYTYVIVSLDGKHPYVGAWRWTGEGFQREVLAVHTSAETATERFAATTTTPAARTTDSQDRQ